MAWWRLLTIEFRQRGAVLNGAARADGVIMMSLLSSSSLMCPLSVFL